MSSVLQYKVLYLIRMVETLRTDVEKLRQRVTVLERAKAEKRKPSRRKTSDRS